MKTAAQALAALTEGNRRFVAEVQRQSGSADTTLRYRLVPQQEPFAIIVGCSDARVPAEIIFDRGLGELFVIRVAGNVITPPQIGSVEFAVENFGTPLVLVLGHSRCGAVAATLDALAHPGNPCSPNLGSIVDCIRPAIEPLLTDELKSNPNRLLAQAVRANIRAAVNQLRHGSAVLEKLIAEGALTIVGAEYSLDTGAVDFFDRNG